VARAAAKPAPVAKPAAAKATGKPAAPAKVNEAEWEEF